MPETASPLTNVLNQFQASFVKSQLITAYIQTEKIPDPLFNAMLAQMGEEFKRMDGILGLCEDHRTPMPVSSKADYLNEIDQIFVKFFGESIRAKLREIRNKP